MDANKINVRELCRDVVHSLREGRGEKTPVVVMAGAKGGEGKSLFLKCLFAVFGEQYVFPAPEPGNYPLLDLPGKKVVFLDDWRFDDDVLSFATQCRWFVRLIIVETFRSQLVRPFDSVSSKDFLKCYANDVK